MSAIEVRSSSKFISEKKYVFDFVFEILNIDWNFIEIDGDHETELYLNEKCIFRCTNDFWIRAESEWLKTSLIPTNFNNFPVPTDLNLGEKYLPVFFGKCYYHSKYEPLPSFNLGFDFFGTIFFLLTGYEERIQNYKGERFSFSQSILNKFNLIERPLVDEYIWFLGAILKRAGLFPLKSSDNHSLSVSCDVDNPFAKNLSAFNLMANTVASCLRAGELSDFKNWFYSYGSPDFLRDPYVLGTIKIMDANERAGNCVTFNFIPYMTSEKKDGKICLSDSKLDLLIKLIVDRGHKIGIHPGFLSYDSDHFMSRSFKSFNDYFRKYVNEEVGLTGRQHYLNWNYSKTDRLLCKYQLHEDSTLGFAESIGFRCGTSHRFKIYDYEFRCSLDLYEQPLIVMEDSLISKRYMGLGYSEEAYNRVQGCFAKCKKFGGKMTLLWHNCHLGSKTDIEFYSALLAIK